MIVNCEYCKYFKGFMYRCYYPDNIIHNYSENIFLQKRSTDMINKYNDCSWYKPKWYLKLFDIKIFKGE